mgnify:FL=1
MLDLLFGHSQSNILYELMPQLKKDGKSISSERQLTVYYSLLNKKRGHDDAINFIE